MPEAYLWGFGNKPGHNDYLHDRVFPEEHARLVGMLAERHADAGRLLA